MGYFPVLTELCTYLLPSAYFTVMLYCAVFTAEISVHILKHCNLVLFTCWWKYKMSVDLYCVL